jgi:lysyl endopeptidase
MKKFPLVMISLFGFSAAAFAAVTENLNSGVNASIPGQTRSAPQARVETQKSATVERFASTAKSVHVVDLGKASDAELQKMQKSAKANESSEKVGRLQIGFPRDIPENMRTVPLSLLPWQALADGSRALRFELAATGAAGMRVGYRFDGPADGAELRFASSAPEATVYKAMSSPGKDLLWSPTMDGERGTIEVLVRAGYNPSAFSLVLEQISQLTVKSSELNSKARSSTCQGTGIGCAESCNVDLACVSNPSQALQDIARATAKMTYVEGGRSFLCTGTLLNSVPFSGVPYFFTNAHCIDSQAAASTLETNWFFDSVSCNSLSTPPSQRLTTGAALLVTDVTMDVTLLRLNSAPPTGAVFAAWDATVVPKSATVVGVHHPSGDLKMFSQGQMQGYVPGPTNCGTSANPVTCDTYLRDSYQSIIWSNGTTEGGSSGSGVYTFNSNCGSGQSCYQLRGGLQGGAASCGNPSGHTPRSVLSSEPTDSSHRQRYRCDD